MTTALIYFGTGFEWLLSIWIERWQKAASASRLVVVTDEDTKIPELPVGVVYTVLRIKLRTFADILRPEYLMDVKEALALAAAARIPGRLLVVDADALFQHDPWPTLLGVGELGAFGMVQDCGERILELGREGRCPEHNAGVLYFDEESPRVRVIFQYIRAFNEFKNRPNPQPVILGQRAWSVAHHRLGGKLLPREVNWSHCWKANPDAAVFHYHGNNGKKKLRATI